MCKENQTFNIWERNWMENKASLLINVLMDSAILIAKLRHSEVLSNKCAVV